MRNIIEWAIFELCKNKRTKSRSRGQICIFLCLYKENRPFPNYFWPLFQSESWCSPFHMKINFHLHANEILIFI